MHLANATNDTMPTFEAHATAVLRQMRGVLAQFVAAVPGGASRPVDLCKALGIDMKLSWSLYQIIGATDLLAAGKYVPRPGATRKLLSASARRGLPGEIIERVSSAAAEFDRLVKVHAGDRPTFDLMIRGRASNGLDKIHLPHRRDAFRANSHIWGVQAKTKLLVHFLQPGSAADMLDCAAVRGMIGLRRIRPNVPWIVARGGICSATGVMLPTALMREALEPLRGKAASRGTAVPLLRKFCSKPLPKVRRLIRPGGLAEDELLGGPVGNAGCVTCLIGDVVRNGGPRHVTATESANRFVAIVRTPCEVLINDLFVREDLFGPLAPELVVYSELQGGPGYPAGGSEPLRLPVDEAVHYLGKGPAVTATPDVPRYPELASYVFRRLGWDGERFDVYRVRLRYPVLSSSVVLRHPLADPNARP